MGKRINYFLVSEAESEDSQIAAILFSNNSHSEYDPEEQFKALANESFGVTELASKLLNEQYPTSADTSRKERPFWLDGTAGDNEKVIVVYWDSPEELAANGFIKPSGPVFIELPALTAPTMGAIRPYLPAEEAQADMKTLTYTRRINILNEKLVMASAEELGRIHGRDDDWTPRTLEDAIEELETLQEGSPQSNGYEILSTSIKQD